MNLKERGITVGDLFILIIIILIAFFSIPKIRNDNSEKSVSYSFMTNYHAYQDRNN
mgnify:CR=1 FL=1